MGLDAVEIIMEVEEAFDIELEESQWTKIRTPHDLIEAVMTRVAHAEPQSCLTRRAFHLLRAALLQSFPLARRDVIPSAQMKKLVPKSARREFVHQLAVDLNTPPLPSLVRPRWLFAAVVAVCLAVGVVIFLVLQSHTSLVPSTVLLTAAIASVAAVGYGFAVATRSLRSEFPQILATAGGVSRWIVAHKMDLSRAPAGHWTREQVAARVREILIAQLSCERTYREDALLVEELGMM
jgi:acyl carrier protein